MYLYIYYHIAKEKIELESDSSEKIHDELKRINFSQPFDFAISKNSAYLALENNDKSCLLHFEDRTNEVFSDIKIDNGDSTIIQQILKTFVNEKESSSTALVFREHKAEQERIAKKKFKNWKIKYESRRKSERFNFLKPVGITLVILLTIASIGYYSYTGEYKFIGQKTDFVKAEVIDTEMVNIGKRFYLQRISFKYEYQNIKYLGNADIGKKIGKREKGDFIKLKIAKNNPEKRIVVGYYY